MNIQVTLRDIELLQWINKVGFVTIEHIIRKWKVSKSPAYDRTKKLIKQGYLIHDHLLNNKPGVYRVTKEGALISGSTLPALKKISLATYYHEIKLVDLNLTLLERYGGSFITERELRFFKGKEAFGQSGHLSDGILILDNKKRIAIELELSRKGKRRREKIINSYLKNFSFEEVWYFCQDEEIRREVLSITAHVKFIKLFLLEEFFNSNSKNDEVIPS